MRGRFFSTSSYDSFWNSQDALGAAGSFDLTGVDLGVGDVRVSALDEAGAGGAESAAMVVGTCAGGVCVLVVVVGPCA